MYCTRKKIQQYRWNESSLAVSFIMRGLRTVVPSDVLRLYTWKELELEICGRHSMDVELLKRNTIFEFGDQSFQKWFWDILKRMDGHSQAQFLRFVWARDRLPLTDEGFKESKFRITEMRRRGAMDRCLPEAATCSFTMTLPRYSSEIIMEKQIRIAIENCSEYDLDGAARGVVLSEQMPPGDISGDEED